jgi:hypothetical protein
MSILKAARRNGNAYRYPTDRCWWGSTGEH